MVKYLNEFDELINSFIRGFHSHSSTALLGREFSAPQFLTLKYLLENKNSKMSDLSRYFEVTLGNMTSIIDRLVREKYVKRAEDALDRRIVRVGLTKAGQKITRKILKIKRQNLKEVFSRISDREKRIILGIMKKLARERSLEGSKKNEK